MSTTRMRQFVVTDRATGIVTLVNAKEWLCKTGQYKGGHAAAATQLGMRAYVDCEVRTVPRGKETPLPFDCIPLQIGRWVGNGN